MTQSENKEIDFSVVIAAWNGVSLLHDCLLSLEKQIEKGGAEVIVVRYGGLPGMLSVRGATAKNFSCRFRYC